MAEDKTIGGEEWTKEFMTTFCEAVTDAAEDHHQAGRPVFFMDDDGDICEFSPDKRLRKLGRAEIERLLTADLNGLA